MVEIQTEHARILASTGKVLVLADGADLLDRMIFEWLSLPQMYREDGCPHCGEKEYGATNSAADLLVYRCRHCRGLFRGRAGDSYDESWLVGKVHGALAAARGQLG